MDERDEIIARLDRIEKMLADHIKHSQEWEETDFDRDVSANLVADFIFEIFINPDSFFDKNS